jgi:hypothetical protein
MESIHPVNTSLQAGKQNAYTDQPRQTSSAYSGSYDFKKSKKGLVANFWYAAAQRKQKEGRELEPRNHPLTALHSRRK